MSTVQGGVSKAQSGGGIGDAKTSEGFLVRSRWIMIF